MADLRIFVIAQQDETTGEVSYSLTQDLNDSNIRVKKDNVIWTNKNEVVTMKFILCDNTDLRLRITDDEKGPFWIVKGDYPNDCPVSKFVAPGFQVGNPKKKKLKVTNPAAPALEKYVYRLRIHSERDGKEYDCDPVIENGGGQGFEQLADSLITGLIGLAAGIGLTYLAGLMGWIHFGR